MVWTYFQFTDMVVKICDTRMKNSPPIAFSGLGSKPLKSQGTGQAARCYRFFNILSSLNIHLDTLIPITKHDEKKVSRVVLDRRRYR